MILFLVHFRSQPWCATRSVTHSQDEILIMPVEKEKGDEKRAKRKERASVTDGSDHEPLENFLKQLEQLEELQRKQCSRRDSE